VACAVIFHLKFYIPTEIPRRDLTLTDKIALLEQVKNQLPNTSHHQLAEITGVPQSITACLIRQQEKL
jgi:hypothetical protein